MADGEQLFEVPFVLASHERWSAASKVAADPEFQHRWSHALPKEFSDGDLFPLMSAQARLALGGLRFVWRADGG
jgi:hypothetical protein